MNPIKLKLKNFTVFKDEEIHFEENGIYVVYGKEKLTHKRNGIGKTSVVEAIRFALYGDTKYKDKDRPISFDSNVMEVEFSFQIDDDVFIVNRLRKRGKSSEAQLLKNGEDTEISGVNEITNEIVRLTGVDYNVFLECFYINKIDLKELTATKLINFLKSVLKLNRFDNYRDKAKECLQKAELKLSKVMGVKETLSQLQSINKNKSEILEVIENSTKEKLKIERIVGEHEKVKEKEYQKHLQFEKEYHKILNDSKSNQKALDKVSTAGICPMCGTNLKDDSLLKKLIKITKQLKLDSMVSEKKSYESGMKLDGMDKKINEFEDVIDKLDEQINHAKYQLEILDSSGNLNSEEIEKEYKRILNLKSKVEQVVELFSPTNFPLYILNQYLPNLELIVNGILGEVLDFSIEIITDKQTKSGKTKRTCELVIYKNGKEYNVNNLSGGEETVINMAFKIGISKMFLSSTNFNLLVIDEGFGALGEINQKTITEMIKRLKVTFKKIFVISHIDNIREYLNTENSINVVKEGSYSKILEENVNVGL